MWPGTEVLKHKPEHWEESYKFLKTMVTQNYEDALFFYFFKLINFFIEG